jgi:hypothetical protein
MATWRKQNSVLCVAEVRRISDVAVDCAATQFELQQALVVKPAERGEFLLAFTDWNAFRRLASPSLGSRNEGPADAAHGKHQQPGHEARPDAMPGFSSNLPHRALRLEDLFRELSGKHEGR